MWIPSTYTACHHGLSHTWSSPGHGSLSRIDYIAIPKAWQAGEGSSQVLYDVDFGQAGVDHFAVCLQITAILDHTPTGRGKHPRIDLQKLHLPESAEVIQAICKTLPAVSWEVDAHTHYDLFSRHLVDNLALAFPVKHAAKRKTFFSDGTWSLRQHRVALRKIVHKASAWLVSFDVRVAWVAWSCRGPLRWAALISLADMLRSTADLQRSVVELRRLKPLLRRSISGDKRDYTHHAATLAASSSSKDTFKKLRVLLGPPKRRIKGARTIPAVKLEDGSIARDLEEAEARWVRHFSSIEAGSPQAPGHIVAECRKRQDAIDLDDYDVEASEILTRTQIEDGLRSSQPGKAPGKDRVPSDLLRLCPSGLSRSLFPIVLKFVMRLQEPIQWKGGGLTLCVEEKRFPPGM